MKRRLRDEKAFIVSRPRSLSLALSHLRERNYISLFEMILCIQQVPRRNYSTIVDVVCSSLSFKMSAIRIDKEANRFDPFTQHPSRGLNANESESERKRHWNGCVAKEDANELKDLRSNWFGSCRCSLLSFHVPIQRAHRRKLGMRITAGNSSLGADMYWLSGECRRVARRATLSVSSRISQISRERESRFSSNTIGRSK